MPDKSLIYIILIKSLLKEVIMVDKKEGTHSFDGTHYDNLI